MDALAELERQVMAVKEGKDITVAEDAGIVSPKTGRGSQEEETVLGEEA